MIVKGPQVTKTWRPCLELLIVFDIRQVLDNNVAEPPVNLENETKI